jgi:hypothetical protein
MKLRFWYSIYGTAEHSSSPIAMLDAVRPRVPELVHEFEPDLGPWQTGRICLRDSQHPTILLRRHTEGDSEVAAKLEQVDRALADVRGEPHRDLVLAHIRRTRQIIYLTPCPVVGLGSSKLARICEQLCGFLAREHEGIIQVFQEGFFSTEGESLLPYCPRHRLKTY